MSRGGVGDIGSGLVADAAGLLGGGADLDQGFDRWEARLTRIAPLRGDPVDVGGGAIAAGLDAAVVLFDGGGCDDLFGRCGLEVGGHVGFEGGLIALQSQDIVRLGVVDLLGDVDLASHGVDGDERPRELAGVLEGVQQFGDGGDLVGFLRHAELSQDEPGIGCVGA